MTRVEELKSLITRYQKSYYDGEGEISDAEFDKLWDELKELDPQNEILHRVGADSGNFPKVKHIMLNLIISTAAILQIVHDKPYSRIENRCLVLLICKLNTRE